MVRPRTPIGTFGELEFTTLPNGTVRARTRFRDHDGRLRRVEASGDTRKSAEHRLKEKLAHRGGYSAGFGELTPDSTFSHLVDVWLEDLDLQGKLAARTSWAMWLFWWLRGHLLQGRDLTRATLAHEDLSGPLRARITAVHAAMAFAQGDLETARCWSAGAELGRSIGDPEGEAHNVAGEGLVALANGDLAATDAYFEETIALTESCGLKGEWLWTLAHVWLGTARLLRGAPEAAAPLLAKALAAGRHREDPLAIYIALFTSVQVSLTTGDLGLARRQLAEGIALSLDTGDMANLAYFLEALAVVEAQGGDPEVVVLLYGAAGRLRETVGSNVYGYYQPDEDLLARTWADARAQLGAAYDDVLARGRQLTLAETIEIADRVTGGAG